MATETNPAPTNFKGVMVSSTFTDLKQHRAALIHSIDGQQFKSVVMENDSAKPAADVLDSDGTTGVGLYWSDQPQIRSDSRVPRA